MDIYVCSLMIDYSVCMFGLQMNNYNPSTSKQILSFQDLLLQNYLRNSISHPTLSLEALELSKHY